MRKFGINILIFTFLSIFPSTSQELSPPIHNYSSESYHAASQNWDIAVDDEGIIYAANHQGLLSFDGQRWELFPLHSRSIIRSVFPYKNRIYTGSYREFGFWEKDTKGDMCYTSLISLIGDYELQSEEFWEILKYKDAIYFRSFGAVYKFHENTVSVVKRINVNQMEVFNDRLIIGIGDEGLFYLDENGDLEPLPNQELINGERIRELIIHNDRLLIGIKNAIYFFDGTQVQRLFNHELEREFELHELNNVLSLGPGEIVIGTLNNGIIYLNEKTNQLSTYNRRDGLQNNTVLSMAHRNGKIWLGLDNGIDAVEIDSPIQFFTDNSGSLGSVYDLVFHQNHLYLASNTGVFKLVNNQLKLLNGAEGHSWNLQVHDNLLYSNHNNGTYTVVNDGFVPVDQRTGSFDIINFDKDKFLIGSYTGIDYCNEFNIVKRLNGINFPVKRMLLEDRRTLWATDAYEGIYRIGLTPLGDSTVFVRKILSENMDGDHNAEVFRINNQIVVFTNGKWYKYNPFSDQLETLNEWHRYENSRLLLQDEELYWFINSEENAVEITNFEGDRISISAKMLNNRTVKNHEQLVKFNDSIYLITLHDGYARINLEKLKSLRALEYISTPVVHKLYDANKYYDLSSVPHIPLKQAKEVTLFVGLPVSDANIMSYELIGKNNSTIAGRVQDGRIYFQNLPHDEYDLRLTAVGSRGEYPVLSNFQFIVDPPWYLEGYMKTVYFLLIVLIPVFIYYINKVKLQKHRQLLKLKYQREHEEQMNRIEKEQLITEINLKRKELANSTMIAAKKNEVLMEIHGELSKDKTKFSNQYRLKHIMNKINSAVKNDDEWKVFETNFNELHEDFFKDLLSKYPQLSNKDLKLCAYLKMNLSSKEIAPLMGISVRGVEVHRYRLRKKMNVDNSENLNNWLISNF